ncbi:MAG: ribose 5-phosphate isomerase A [Spirochaetaceae bacterium]|nr:MAG: ribose 5-phosphate isomerase A [Spirochaetaceae bacterium]
MKDDQVKELLGRTVAERFVQSGMKLGLGTGSTAVWAIRRIGELLQEGVIDSIVGVATSSQSEVEAHAAGIALRTMNDPEMVAGLDLTIDGADEVDAHGNLTKGGGGALLIEKVVAYASKRVIIIVGQDKLVNHLGLRFPIPVEVVPLARMPVVRTIEELGCEVKLRTAVRKMGAVITDNGNIILDVSLPAPTDIAEFERVLNNIPGVVENGVFSRLAAEIWYGTSEGQVLQFAPRR